MNTVKINKRLVVVDRYCGYALFFLMCLYFVTGYGRTKNILDPYITKLLHEVWLPIPTIVAFIAHSLLNVRFILIRRGVEDKLWWNIYLVILGAVIFAVFFYIQLS